MSNVLYYPSINLPNTEWTIRSLLYYNSISSIVPQEYFIDPEKNYDSHMLELVRKELVIPINPQNILNNSGEFSKSFLDFITSDEYDIKWKRDLFKEAQSERIHSGKFPIPIRISAEKFNDDILYSLASLGLAIRKYESNWYYVEKQTASYLMEYLATVVSKKMNLIPITDKIDKIIIPENKYIQGKKRQIILEELIPIPLEININKILNFKDKFYKDLESFRTIVELLTINESIEENSDLFNLKIKELKERKDDLVNKMKKNQFNDIFFGSICGMLGAIQGMAIAETTGAVIGGLPGFANAIHSALKIEKPEDIFDQSGIKYLALIDYKLIK